MLYAVKRKITPSYKQLKFYKISILKTIFFPAFARFCYRLIKREDIGLRLQPDWPMEKLKYVYVNTLKKALYFKFQL